MRNLPPPPFLSNILDYYDFASYIQVLSYICPIDDIEIYIFIYV